DSVVRNVPGMASNVLPLRLAIRSSMTVSQVVREAAFRIRESLEHQHYQTRDLRRDLGASADGRTLFGVSMNFMRFNYDLAFAGRGGVANTLSLGPVDDLSIGFYDRRDGGPLRIDFDANPNRHAAADLVGHQQRYARLLTAVADPESAIGSLNILSRDERTR